MKMMKEEKDKYYKLLKDLPDVKAGAIFKLDEEDYLYKYCLNSLVEYEYSMSDVRHLTEWFEPCLFISEDGEPVFNNDRVHLVYNDRIVNIGKATKYGFDGSLTDILASDCLWFKSRQKAEEYIESLKPKFKVGDIIVTPDNKIEEIKYISNFTAELEEWYENINNLRLATNEEIIKYYESQGWVKGAKFKYNNKIQELFFLTLYQNEVFAYFTYGWGANIKDCELIKEPELPKSWEELKEVKGYYINNRSEIVGYVAGNSDNKICKNIFNNEKQALSSLAFAQLSQLVKVMNGDWQPDFNDGTQSKYYVQRWKDELSMCSGFYKFHPLVFPTEKLAEFSLEHHRKLWEEYYEL